MNKIALDKSRLRYLHDRDMRQQSYNIEMTELTGGTFWAPYTEKQISGEESFPTFDDPQDMVKMLKAMHVRVPEIDLYEKNIRTLAAALGPVIVRFSGSWATRTYFDADDTTNGVVPEGFEFVLTKKQWKGALDFAKAVNAKILVSVANCRGVHENGTGAWLPDQARALWAYTAEQGMQIDYAEFMNEPNMLPGMMLPDGYGIKELARDHDLFAQWLRSEHPETRYVGPCSADGDRKAIQGGAMMPLLKTRDILDACTIMPDIFSYHSYSCISERGAMFGVHYPFEEALTERYLNLTAGDLKFHSALRDEYTPGADIWITESADAACGGNTWAPTYAETLRYLDEQCRFAKNAHGVIFHNTLASSAYGLLDEKTHEPRPQYWGGLLFNRLCGEKVYETGEPLRQGAHIFAFASKTDAQNVCYVCINTSTTEPLHVYVPDGTRYLLDSEKLRSTKIRLNGETLCLTPAGELPALAGQPTAKGEIELPPASILFYDC